MTLTGARSPTLDWEISSPSDIERKDEYSNTPLLAYISDPPSFHEETVTRRKPNHTRTLSIIIAVLFSTNLITIICLVTWNTAPTCSSTSDPPHEGPPGILSTLPLTTTPTLFTATLHDPTNPYRLHSSATADAAWNTLIADTGVLLVQKGDEETAGIDAARHVYWDEEEKGLVGYPVVVEAVHQLHCLNVVRRNLWYNVEWTRGQYTEGGNMMDEGMRVEHVDHCVDLLRQRLMCTADTGLLPMVWVGDQGQYVADFVRWHTCRSHEALRSLVREKAVPGPEAGETLPKPGDFMLDDYE